MKNTHPHQRPTIDSAEANMPKYKRANSTGTWFGCIFYGNVEQLKQFAEKEISRIEHLTYIVHDKDVKDDGTPKETHIHVLLKNNATISNATLRNRFARCCFKDEKGMDVNTKTQIAYDPVEADEYLCHADDAHKHIYEPTEKVCLVGDPEDITRARRKTADGDFIIQQPVRKDNSFEILEKMFKGVSKWQLAKEYGRDFIMNVQKYEFLLRSMNASEWLEAQGVDDAEGYIDAQCMARADVIDDVISGMRKETERMRKLNANIANSFERRIDEYMNKVGMAYEKKDY